MISKHIVHDLELLLHETITGVSAVSGGDIALAYKINTGRRIYFLKVGRQNQPAQMLPSEAEGLRKLRENFSGKVPEVIAQQTSGNEAWLLLEWLEEEARTDTAMQQFGIALAAMHTSQHNELRFGFHADNYIACLQQSNRWYSNWSAFMHQQRIMPLVQMLAASKAFQTKDVEAAERLGSKLPALIPEEKPSLLHGDLWSGNYLITKENLPAVFDPAVYYGHREMDIALTLLFGGFTHRFYEAYQYHAALQPGFKERVPLMQLYPLLVHAVLFGGEYVRRCREVVKSYL